MKAFLSHSSRDKGLVEEVARLLGGANIELDSTTFDRGVLNVAAIQQALNRSILFVLFLSESALESSAVLFEALTAQEMQTRGVIDKIIVVCLDNESFGKAPDEWKVHNFVRKAVSAQSIARLIQGSLIAIRSRTAAAAQPFVGRQKELHDAKDKLIDPRLSTVRAIYVSGNPGIGRRTFARKLYSDVYPSVNPVFAEIYVDKLDGYEEIYRKLLDVLNPISTLASYRARIMGFAIANEKGKVEQIAALINRLLEAREAILIHDDGGILEDSGAFQSHIHKLLQQLKGYPYPPAILITQRMMPQSKRSDIDYVVFCPLPSLDRDDARQLIGFLLRNAGVTYTVENLDQLVELSDYHPFNAAFLVEAIKQYTLPVFLGDITALIQWKRNRSSEFLQKIEFSIEERLILGALRDFRALDFDLLTQIAGDNVQATATVIARLIDYHILESVGGTYVIAPPIRVAVERDARFDFAGTKRREVLIIITKTLNARIDDQISVSMVGAGILASLQEGGDIPELFSALLLPSHLVWLARRRYDEKQNDECLRLAKVALEDSSRLSPAGTVEACRLLCLASSRMAREEDFQFGIGILKRHAREDWAKSNLEFLLGFNERLKGHLPVAEDHFREAYRLSRGNFSAAHGLASVCKVRGDLTSAEQFSRRAYEVAPDNPYVLDILLSVLINVPPSNLSSVKEEMSFLFDKLSIVGEQEGHSFYTTRRAEYEMKHGNLNEACKLIDDAAKKTPGIFNVQALKAEIYLDRGNKLIAFEAIQNMQRMIDRNSTGERRANVRQFLEIKASYLASNGQYNDAKGLYRTPGVFTETETLDAIRRLDIEQAYSRRSAD
jgi:tetratricopeptide (TPR) repeat protein